MLSIDGRSPAAYGHTKHIPAAGFAWEYCAATTNIVGTFRPSHRPEGRLPATLKRSRIAGVCEFPCDPDAPHDRQSLIWCPRLQPQAVMLSPVDHKDDDTEPILTLAHLEGLDLRQATDGWHGIWQVDGVTHQFWLPEAVPDAAAFYAVTLPMDSFLELRTHAARRFWRSLTGRAPGPDFRAVPAQLRQWHILTLRALDARLRGCAAKAIAPSPKCCSAFAGRRRIGKSIPGRIRPGDWSRTA